MAKPRAPKYVKLPGRPKKERMREPHEKPKKKIISKTGTVIRCTKCKQTGHNKSTCERRSSGRPSKAASQSHVQPAQSEVHANSLNAMVRTCDSAILCKLIAINN